MPQRKPDFINEIGVKWWVDYQTTKYARNQDIQGTTLDVTAFIVEFKNGERYFVLVDAEGNPIYEGKTIDGIGGCVKVS